MNSAPGARSYDRILRVARTIADLAEVLTYRRGLS
ncbi:MAG: hypothetical protein KatS3mg070_2245 [Meiothermus sp.]|nr:hypothetical protein [Meiothermus sp.]GIW28882.1 MAG: hypothetical protein KatS3mg070_2245 [Meiothermus sp.]